MLTNKIEHFTNYCKLSNFAKKSIETLNLRLKEFNRFITGAKPAVSEFMSQKVD